MKKPFTWKNLILSISFANCIFFNLADSQTVMAANNTSEPSTNDLNECLGGAILWCTSKEGLGAVLYCLLKEGTKCIIANPPRLPLPV